ncbi:hypothetical protein AGMMS50256_02980 [Betaproteobacteria bacterium]|nr:hypothetical protein AGMMS50256_02980 [Betaproteobacteria bacterium]
MAEATTKATPAAKKTAAKTTKTSAVDTKPKAKKTEPAKAPAVKKTPAPAPGKVAKAPKAPVEKKTVSDEQRYRMIAEAAYYRAESSHFKSDSLRDWIEAERDIALLLGESK